MRKLFALFSIIITLLLACDDGDSINTLPVVPETPDSDVPSNYYPPINGNEWESIPPDSLHWNSDSLAHLLDFVSDKNTYGFLIIHRGKIVAEKYWDGWNENTALSVASTGKSITAFITGIVQQEGLINIDHPVSNYLGEGWTNLSPKKEQLITVQHLLTMTSGIRVEEGNHCNAPSCLNYQADAGNHWAYHNVAYSILHHVLEKVTGVSFDELTKTRLAEKIGMRHWTWDNYMLSLTTRDMARFGLLILNRGKWDSETILADSAYFKAMITPSNKHNRAYGYLWWLNGQESYKIPETPGVHKGSLVPAAPADMIAAMGRGDKKIYVVPSLDLVIVRHGEDTGNGTFGPSSFDNDIWKKLNGVMNRQANGSN